MTQIRHPNGTYKNKQQRRKDAEERQAATAKLTTKQRIAHLDKLFGKGIGAKKERLKLAKLKAESLKVG